VTTRGIHDDNFEFLLFKEVNTLFGDFNWICLFLVTEERALDLGCIHFKLLEGTSTERISAHQANSPSLLHVMISKLCTCGSLSRSLQANEHDHIWLSLLELIGRILAVQHISKLIDHSPLNQLPNVDTFSASIRIHMQ